MNKGQSDWMPPLAYYTAKPETNRELTVIPKGFHVRHCPTKPARFGLRKGPGSQVSGAPTGSNGIGFVPAAFRR